jgi:hypothetical protein
MSGALVGHSSYENALSKLQKCISNILITVYSSLDFILIKRKTGYAMVDKQISSRDL